MPNPVCHLYVSNTHAYFVKYRLDNITLYFLATFWVLEAPIWTI